MSGAKVNPNEVVNQKEPLQTTINVERNGKILKVVLEMKADKSDLTRIPIRYSLVIDTSASMGGWVGNDRTPILERMKTLALRVVDYVSENDSVSIITFHEIATIEVPMTKMSNGEKEKAKKVIKNLETVHWTNISDGLMTALNQISDLQDPKGLLCHDCILILTDGIPTCGIKDPDELIKVYLEKQQEMKRTSSIPISAFFLGDDLPDYMYKLSEKLGSESFYWLDGNKAFEADLFLPILMRENNAVSDVNVTVKALMDAKLKRDECTASLLQEDKTSDTKLCYFINAMPVNHEKHLFITMILPGDEGISDGDRILNVEYEYLDSAKRARVKIDSVIYESTTVMESKSRSIKNNGERMKDEDSTDPQLGQIVAYKQHLAEIYTDWQSVADAMAAVANETCRLITLKHLEILIENGCREDSDKQTAQELRTVVDAYLRSTGRTDNSIFSNWEKKVIRSSYILKPGQLRSMQSSIGREMPTVRGIFDDEEGIPYLPADIGIEFRQRTECFESELNERIRHALQLFKGKIFVISESLQNEFIGGHSDGIDELIKEYNGRIEYRIPSTKSNNVYLICTADDLNGKSRRVQGAMRAKMPRVTKEFVVECIISNSILNWKGFRPRDKILQKIYGDQKPLTSSFGII